MVKFPFSQEIPIKDISKYLVDDFEYLCYPNASDITLEITTPYIKIKRIVGSGKEGVEETIDKSGWNYINFIRTIFNKRYFSFYYILKGKI